MKWYLDNLGISDDYIGKVTYIDIQKIREDNILQSASGKIQSAISFWRNGDLDKNIPQEVGLYYGYWRTQTDKIFTVQKLYWDIYSFAKRNNPLALFITFISYSIGIILIGIVLFQSVIDVIMTIKG